MKKISYNVAHCGSKSENIGGKVQFEHIFEIINPDGRGSDLFIYVDAPESYFKASGRYHIIIEEA